MTSRILAEIDSVFQHVASQRPIGDENVVYWRGALDCITLVAQKIGNVMEEELAAPVELKLFVPTEESERSS